MAHNVPSRVALAGLVVAVAVGCSTTEPAPEAPAGTSVDAPTSGADDGPPAPLAASPSAEVQRLFEQVPPIHPSVDDYDRGEVVLTGPDGQRWELPVLVARTSEERQHGLMEVPEMPDGTGMAFVFEDDRDGGFWMFGTLMDIDIVYVSATGQPVATFTMVPCAERPCPSYPPGARYRNTLEVPGGFWDRIGFTTEWTVTFDV